jgi:hypothetical protein
LISVVRIPGVRDESEDLWRDPTDRGEVVLPGPNKTDDLGGVPLENLNLKHDMREQPPQVGFVGYPNLGFVEDRRSAAKSNVSSRRDKSDNSRHTLR